MYNFHFYGTGIMGLFLNGSFKNQTKKNTQYVTFSISFNINHSFNLRTKSKPEISIIYPILRGGGGGGGGGGVQAYNFGNFYFEI